MITTSMCQQALDLHAAALMQLPGVQGVGIGQGPANRPDCECSVVVYSASDQAPARLPKTLHLSFPDGNSAEIPVIVQKIGVIRPE
jgi:hypothetical protein